jgi:hypothetical protein
MSLLLTSATNLLWTVRQETDAIGVAVSFGKDSLATLDLCCATFPRVEAYYLYRVAGLRIVDEWAAAVRQRVGVRVRPYPHFDLSRCYRHALLSPHWQTKVRRITMADIEAQFRADACIGWIAYGWRRNDSFSRALIMRRCGGIDFGARRVFPLRRWRRIDVLDHLRMRAIPVPHGLGRKEQGGLDFHPAALAYLREHYPDDYERWVRDFPFSGVQGIQSPSLPATGRKIRGSALASTKPQAPTSNQGEA